MKVSVFHRRRPATEIMKDPEIIYFTHCDTSKRIFCLEVPDVCPVCHEILAGKEDQLATKFVRCPFVTGKESKCSILIKPTTGDFLHSYRNSCDLHIGVTDSEGVIYEFDSHGVRKSFEGKKWQQCLAITCTGEKDPQWFQHWDYTLTITASMDTWSALYYQECELNCYSFVMTFLKMLHCPTIKKSLSSKQQFCSDFIVSRTHVAAKYISLYRQVIRDGVSVINVKKATLADDEKPALP